MSSSQRASFLWGAVSALSFVYVYITIQKEKKGKRENPTSRPSNEQQSTADEAASAIIFDRPDLDLRLIRKAEAVIRGRTDKIVIVVERCTNDHNYSAILRTAEALGIQTVCIIDPPPATAVEADGTVVTPINDGDDEQVIMTVSDNHRRSMPPVRLTETEKNAFEDHRKFAQNATEWLTIREFPTATECLSELQKEEYTVWVTDLSQEAVPLTEADLQQHELWHKNGNNTSCSWPMPQKIALVMGTEAVGCSQEMLLGGDLRVYLPLAGFADSLNLSVATALVVQQLFHLNPDYAGNMSEANRRALRQTWFPKLAQQRLLSARDKKQRKAVRKQIQICERLQCRFATGERLTPEQLEKIGTLPVLERELQALEDASQFGQAEAAVADLIACPPEPLTDLRRADPHRVTYVGKKTKKLHSHHWKDMVATTNTVTTLNATAAFFRNRVNGGSRSPT